MHKEAEKKSSLLMVSISGNYTLKVFMDCGKILIKAFSEREDRLFEGSVEEDGLSEGEKMMFGDCDTIFTLMTECITERRIIELSDGGALSFPYSVATTKKQPI